MVVDMVKDFVTGSLGGPGARSIVPRLKSLLARARSKGISVVYVCDAHEPGNPELDVWGHHSMKGTEGAEIIEELSPQEGDSVFEKQAFDAFTNPALDEELKQKGVEELVLTGVATNICVQNTAANAFYRGYRLTVVKDCTAARSEEEHREGLKYMESMFGAKVLKADEAL